MKRHGYKITLILILLIPYTGFPQDENFTPKFKEFIKQKKLNKRYIAEYIITSIAKRLIQMKMHKQSKKSLGQINNDKNQNFLEDVGFIERLGKLPPILAESPYLVKTLSIQNNIIKYCQKTKKMIHGNSDLMSNDEGDYYLDAFKNLLDVIGQDVDQLFAVVVENGLKLSTDERLTRLKTIAAESKRKEIFAQMLYTRTVTLVENRKTELNELQLKTNFNDYEN